MSRHNLPKRRDKKIFRNTATRTRKLNLPVVVPRGGIRL